MYFIAQMGVSGSLGSSLFFCEFLVSLMISCFVLSQVSIRLCLFLSLLLAMALHIPVSFHGSPTRNFITQGECQKCDQRTLVLRTPHSFRSMPLNASTHYGKETLCIECWQPLLPNLPRSEVSQEGTTLPVNAPVDVFKTCATVGCQKTKLRPSGYCSYWCELQAGLCEEIKTCSAIGCQKTKLRLSGYCSQGDFAQLSSTSSF